MTMPLHAGSAIAISNVFDDRSQPRASYWAAHGLAGRIAHAVRRLIIPRLADVYEEHMYAIERQSDSGHRRR